jgi:hypothetical protein
MIDQITIEEALELVDFELYPEGWRVKNVKGNVRGDVGGDIWGAVLRDVCGNVHGNVLGSVCGDVYSDVGGTINGRLWKFIETPKERLRRLIEEDADKDKILEALDRLEDSND